MLDLLDCKTLRREIRESLSENEKETIRKIHAHFQESQLKELEDAFYSDIFEYIAATPSHRKKTKRWNDHQETKIFLIYFALKYLELADMLIEALRRVNDRVDKRHYLSEYARVAAYIRTDNIDVLT